MGLWAGIRTALRRIGAAPWETKIGVAIPLLLGMLAIPAMLGAFASDVHSTSAVGGYGTTTTIAVAPSSIAATTTTKPIQTAPAQVATPQPGFTG